MKTIKILIAEDEASSVEIYTDAIGEFNKENHEIKIEETVCTDKTTALLEIENNYFDAAFIDLNLSNSLLEDEGLELITAIQNNSRYPVYIVSGQTHKIKHDFNNRFISKHSKADVKTDELLLDIKKIYETGLTNVLGAKGIIEKSLTKIFWNHFSDSKDYWINHSLSRSDQLERIMSRYTLQHLLEYFQLDDSGEEVKSFDSSEMYIMPYIKSGLYPGSIVVYEENKYLILTPACDLAQGNCNCLTLIKLNELFKLPDLMALKTELNEYVLTSESLITSNKESIEKLNAHGLNVDTFNNLNFKNNAKEFSDYFSTVLNELEKLPCTSIVSKLQENCKQLNAYNITYDKKVKTINKAIKPYISNNISNRFYFLAEFLDFKAKVIDFQDIKTLDISEIASVTKIMDISIPFIRDIQEKFSSYYARQGAPDFDFEAVSANYTTKFLK